MTEKPTEPRTPEACPSWCAGAHPIGVGAVHRVVIGRVRVGDEEVLAVVLQTPDHSPSVVISGPVFVEISGADHDDAAALLTLLGHAGLAELVRRAAKIVRKHAARRDAEVGS